MLSGTRANIAVKIFGDDLQMLRQLATQVQAEMAQVAGVVDLSTEAQTDIPTLKVRVDPAAAARQGLETGAVAEALQTARVGQRSARSQGQVAFPLVVRYAIDDSTDLDSVGNTQIQTPDRRQIPLSAVATIQQDRGPNFVMRENVQRRIVVQSNVAGRDLRSVVNDIQARVAPERRACRRATTSSTAGSSRARPRRRVSCSGCRSAWSSRSSSSVVGVRLVAGRPADHAQPAARADRRRGRRLPGRRRAVGGVDRRLHHAVRHRDAQRHHARLAHPPPAGARRRRPTSGRRSSAGATERLVPILMTALAAGLALVPIALSAGEPGSEIQAPMAMVIMFGLLSSTALNMVVVPILYERFGRRVSAARN